MNAKAPIEDQRTLLYLIRNLAVPPDESVRETQLLYRAREMGIMFPEEGLREVLTSGHAYRVIGPGGVFIRRTEK